MNTPMIFICLALVVTTTLISQLDANEMILKTEGKKGKGGSIIVLGKKCVPTIVKSGGKKGKDIIIVGNNHDCHQTHYSYSHKPHYIPIPIYHQVEHQYHHHPPVYMHETHEYDSHGYGGGGDSYGGGHDDGGGYGHDSYGGY